MGRKRVFLILTAAACALLAALLGATAIGIWRDGAARRAADPLASVYSPEIVSRGFASVAPLFFVTVGLAAAGLLLGAGDGIENRPARDAVLGRDFIAARVARPSEAMRRERARQRWLLVGGGVAFALCMVPIVIYTLNAEHFPREDLEGMFAGLMRVCLPWTAAGLAAPAAALTLRERSARREITAAKARMAEERAASLAMEPSMSVPAKDRRALRIALVVAAAALIVAGVLNGGARDVLTKAINICTECVGLG